LRVQNSRVEGTAMNVREAMKTPVATCRPGSSLAAAGIEMLRHDCGVLPVVEAERGLAGVITDRDICIALATRGRPAERLMVGSVMSTNLQTVGPDDDVRHAVRMMERGRVRRLPVVTDGWKLVGIITINDIVLLAGTSAGASLGLSSDELITALQGILAHWRSNALRDEHATSTAA
jgi:CBS domain-containing protein